jgi:hypothetical protein
MVARHIRSDPALGDSSDTTKEFTTKEFSEMLTLVHTRSDGEATTASSAQNSRKHHLMSGATAVACLGDSQAVRVILTAYRSPELQRKILLERHPV